MIKKIVLLSLVIISNIAYGQIVGKDLVYKNEKEESLVKQKTEKERQEEEIYRWVTSFDKYKNLSKAEVLDLKKLVLKREYIKEIPSSIGCLSNLQKLNLGYNQLTTVPESIGKLFNLKILDLSENQIATVPKFIRKLSKLENLRLDGNQLNSSEKEKIKKFVLKNCKVEF